MRNRRAWVMPDEDARSMLRQIGARIRSSDISAVQRRAPAAPKSTAERKASAARHQIRQS